MINYSFLFRKTTQYDVMCFLLSRSLVVTSPQRREHQQLP